MFGVVPKALWQKVYPADENNLCNWACRSLLIEDGRRKILIDNGFGDKQDACFFSQHQLNGGEGLVEGLAKYDISPDDITDMVITHLHYDHCGGGSFYDPEKKHYELLFKNATYWISKPHWEWIGKTNTLEADSFLKENIVAMKQSNKLSFITESKNLMHYFKVRIFDGHTHGMIIPYIAYRGKTIVFVSDLIPSTAHIPLTYNMAYDIEPLKTISEKEEFLQEAVKNEYILFFQHDVNCECCTVHSTLKGITVKETFSLREYFGD